MALEAGTQVGAYEVISPLGAGGMGEVYRARDTKLQRDVALKILPEAMAHDAYCAARSAVTSIPLLQTRPDLPQVPAARIAAEPDRAMFEGIRVSKTAGQCDLMEIVFEPGAIISLLSRLRRVPYLASALARPVVVPLPAPGHGFSSSAAVSYTWAEDLTLNEPVIGILPLRADMRRTLHSPSGREAI